MPLRTFDAERVAEELVKLFSRVGIPKELLTDQGSNYTSQLLAEIYRLLHVYQIPHPITRKQMGLWSALTRPSSRFWERPPWMKEKIGIRWSHTSSSHTGNFPRHPLGSSNCYTAGLYVGLWMFFGRHGVTHALRAAKDGTDDRDNLTRPQQRKKRWYDRTAWEREFQQGDLVLVLVLLPTSTHKLLAKWKGPYPTPMLAPSPDWTDASNALVQEKRGGECERLLLLLCA